MGPFFGGFGGFFFDAVFVVTVFFVTVRFMTVLVVTVFVVTVLVDRALAIAPRARRGARARSAITAIRAACIGVKRRDVFDDGRRGRRIP
jgi:hypothetical protein